MSNAVSRLFGAYTLRVNERVAPKIINACKAKDISILSTYAEESHIYFLLDIFACREFVKVTEALGIQAETVKETGLPFVLSRYKSRWGIYIGLVLSMAFLLYSSMLLWEIRVTGNVTISENEIIQVISRYGIGVGTFIPSIDADRTAEYILIDYTPLSSLAINVDGTVATVDVIERAVKPPDTFPSDGVCNLAAECDGVITKVQAHEGTPEVKVGQVVTEGQMLINGVVKNRYGAYKLVNAKGYVYADVNQDAVIEIPLNIQGKKYTGKEKTKREIHFLGRNVPLYIDDECRFQSFEVTGNQRTLTLFGLKTPFVLSEATYREYTLTEYSITQAEAQKRAQARFKMWCEKECEGELVSVELTEETTNSLYRMTVKAVVNKNIAERKEIILTPHTLP